MNEILSDAGALIGIVYTVALLGHILHKGFIAKTFAAYKADGVA